MEVYRNKCLKPLLDTMEPYLPLKGFNPFLWLQDDRNICLGDGDGSFALFEYDDGIYNGHYFYKIKGKEAVEFSKKALESLFSEYPVLVLRGYTPMTKKGALWLSRHLGFKPVGTCQIDNEENQIWLMTKEAYERKYSGQ